MIGQNTDLEHEIRLKVGGQPLDITSVELVEFSFGDLLKYYPTDSSVRYDNGSFFVRLTQEETLDFDKVLTVQLRVKFNNGNIPLSARKTFQVEQSQSKEIL